MNRWLRGGRQGDDGSALILALVFLTVFGTMIFALTAYTATGLIAGATVNEQRDAGYAADGAMESAIQSFRSRGACLDRPPAVNQTQMTVVCAVSPGDGTDPAPPGGVDDPETTKPRRAVLTLGTDAADGIVQSSAAGLRVKGGVFAHSRILNSGGTMTVDGLVASPGNCSGPITSAFPPLQCANRPGGAADPADGTDPDYARDSRAALTPRAVPPCPGPDPADWLVTLQPGYYDDAAALSALTTTGACPDHVVWLPPGAYVFNFGYRDRVAGTCTDCPATWTVNEPSVTVVAGTPSGWDPAAPTLPPGPLVPGACVPADDPGLADGVQLVFGGLSRLHVESGSRAELCPRSAPAQQISVYGLRTTTLPGTPPQLLTATGFDAPTVAAFADPERAVARDCTTDPTIDCTADATLASGGPTAAAVTLTGYNQVAVPAGSAVHAVTLRIRHQETGDVDRIHVRVASPAREFFSQDNDASPCDRSRSLCLHPTLVDDTIPLAGLGFAAPGEFDNLTVEFEAFLSGAGTTGTVALDGAEIDVVFTPPTTLTAVGPVQDGAAWTAPEQALVRDGTSASTVLDPAGATTALITLPGYAMNLPAGAGVRKVTMRAAHGEALASDPTLTPAVTVQATIIPAAGGPPITRVFPLHAGVTTDEVDLTPDASDPAWLAGFSVRWDVTLDPAALEGGTVFLDGIDVEVQFAPPVFEAQTGCVIDPGANCPVLSATGTGTVLIVRGTVYAPRSRVDLVGVDLIGTGVAVPLLGRGVISRALRLGVTPENGFTGPVVELPGHQRTVVFTVLRNASSRSLSPSGTASVSGFSFPTNALAIDGTTSDATLAPSGTASITLTGYGQPSPIPPGSYLNSATLRIAHRTEGDIASLEVTVLPAAGGSPVSIPYDPTDCDEAIDLCRHETLGEDRIDLRARGLTDPAELAGLALRYDVSAGAATADASLDGAVVEVVFTPPSVLPAGSTSENVGFSNPDRALAIDGNTADATLAPSGLTTAGLTLGTFKPLVLPRGSIVRGVTLRIAHREDAPVDSVSAIIRPSGFPEETVALPPHRGAGPVADRVDLLALFPELDDPAELALLAIRFEGTLAPAATEPGVVSLDGASIEIAYEVPALRARVAFDDGVAVTAWNVRD